MPRYAEKDLRVFAVVFALFVLAYAAAQYAAAQDLTAQAEEEPPYVGPVIFNEERLDEYPFCPGSYPEYTEANPTADCATWENGGLAWLPMLEEEWGVVVWRPIWRFCGVPRPLPERSDVVNIPSEWLRWRDAQAETAPAPP